MGKTSASTTGIVPAVPDGVVPGKETINNSSSSSNNNNNNNNNNRIQRRNSRFLFTISSLRREPSPTRTLK